MDRRDAILAALAAFAAAKAGHRAEPAEQAARRLLEAQRGSFGEMLAADLPETLDAICTLLLERR